MLAILKINQASSKRIYERIINPNLLQFTIRIVGNKLVIHSNDYEYIEKVLDRNSLNHTLLTFKYMSKYTWNPETINHFQFMSSYVSGEEIYEAVQEFVEVDCQLEDGDTEDMLVQDLYKQIFN